MRVGGARPPPRITFTLTSKVAVYAPAEWADTLTLFHLYQYVYSVPLNVELYCIRPFNEQTNDVKWTARPCIYMTYLTDQTFIVWLALWLVWPIRRRQCLTNSLTLWPINCSVLPVIWLTWPIRWTVWPATWLSWPIRCTVCLLHDWPGQWCTVCLTCYMTDLTNQMHCLSAKRHDRPDLTEVLTWPIRCTTWPATRMT